VPDNVDDMLAAKQAKKQEATDADAWDPAPGEKIVGVLLRADVVKTRRGPSLLLVVRNTGEESGGIDTDESGLIWGSRTVLQGELMNEQPAVGAPIAILYEGKQEPKQGGNPYHGYVVIVTSDDPNHRDEEKWMGIEDALDEPNRRRNQRRTTKEATDEDGKPNYF
jgi:hypothetical protein